MDLLEHTVLCETEDFADGSSIEMYRCNDRGVYMWCRADGTYYLQFGKYPVVGIECRPPALKLTKAGRRAMTRKNADDLVKKWLMHNTK